MPHAEPEVQCGLVAQELEEMIPSAVDTAGLLGGGMRLIVSEHLDPYYIRAFQQLLARVEELETRLNQKESLI